MNLFKPVAGAILLNSALLVGALTTVSFTTSFEAAASYHCPVGKSHYHGLCISYRHKYVLQQKAAPKEKKCTTLPVPLPGHDIVVCG